DLVSSPPPSPLLSCALALCLSPVFFLCLLSRPFTVFLLCLSPSLSHPFLVSFSFSLSLSLSSSSVSHTLPHPAPAWVLHPLWTQSLFSPHPSLPSCEGSSIRGNNPLSTHLFPFSFIHPSPSPLPSPCSIWCEEGPLPFPYCGVPVSPWPRSPRSHLEHRRPSPALSSLLPPVVIVFCLWFSAVLSFLTLWFFLFFFLPSFLPSLPPCLPPLLFHSLSSTTHSSQSSPFPYPTHFHLLVPIPHPASPLPPCLSLCISFSLCLSLSLRSTASHTLHQYCCPTQVLDSMKLTPSGRLAESREEEEEEETEEEEEEDAHQFCCPASECSSPSSR
uniref:IQ motif and Sec7 domain ArfGEF 2 n=1 Tax=Bos indicus x Bos taurus TaxID=30522 RepID=A0A4W2FQN1_BOBOX